MTNKITPSKQDVKNNMLLPEDTKSAVNVMTDLTRQMLEFMMEETKLLKAKEAHTLAKIQKGKELRAQGYANAAHEFTQRAAEFKKLDENLIGTLEVLTAELGKATRTNQKLIEAMSPKKPLKENMTNNLFMLQSEGIAGAAE